MLPTDIRPGKHLFVIRYPRSDCLGGPADFLYPIDIENPDFGKELTNPAYAQLQTKLKGQAVKYVSLRRAIDQGHLVKAFAGETVIPSLVADNWFDTFEREGFLNYQIENRGAENVLKLGHHAPTEIFNRALIRVDLSGVPKQTKIKGACLTLIVAGRNVTDQTRLEVYAMRREWNELAETNGWSCHNGPKVKMNNNKSEGEMWGKPGADDPEKDRFPEPAAVVELKPLMEKDAAPFVTLDITDLVVKWHSGQLPNDGILLALKDKTPFVGGVNLVVYSSEFSNPILRPTLVLACEGADPKPVFTILSGEDLNAALASSRMTKKPLALFFKSDACNHSTLFKDKVLKDPAVQKALEADFIFQTLSVENWPKVCEQMSVVTPPTILIVKPDGKTVQAKATGMDLMDRAQFTEFLKKQKP